MSIMSLEHMISEAREMQETGRYINGIIFHALVAEIDRLRALVTPDETTQTTTQCYFEGCDQPAVEMACGRAHGRYVNPSGPYLMKQHPGHPTPAWYCSVHAELVADEDCPEYKEMCPNCGCRFGVN